jgi:hypothetical protein
MKWQERLHNRTYLRQIAEVDLCFLLAEHKSSRLELLARLNLRRARRLSAQEEELTYRPSADAERYQHLVDATTDSLGQVIRAFGRGVTD